MAKRKMCIYVLNMVMNCWEYNNRLLVFTENKKKEKNFLQIEWDSAMKTK